MPNLFHHPQRRKFLHALLPGQVDNFERHFRAARRIGLPHFAETAGPKMAGQPIPGHRFIADLDSDGRCATCSGMNRG